MRNKYIFYLLVLLSIIAVGCNQTNEKTTDYEAMESKAYLESAEIPSNLLIDIKFEEVKEIKSAKSYKVNYMTFAKQLLIDTFIESEIVEEVIWAEGPGLRATGSNVEEYLNMHDDGAAFFDEKEVEPNGFQYGKTVAGINSNNLWTIANVYFDDTSFTDEYGLNSDYESYNNLDFLPLEDALLDVNAVLEKVDMSPLMIDEAYSIDFETMQIHYKLYLEKMASNELYDPDEIERVDWTKDDEFYLLSMQQVVEDIPVINKPWLMPDGVTTSAVGSSMPYTQVHVMYDKSGLRNVSAFNLFEIDKEIEQHKLITIFEALDNLMELYSLGILEEEVSIIDADLLYLIIPKDDEIELTPGWVFENTKTIVTDDGYEYEESRYDVVDAITGKVYQDRW